MMFKQAIGCIALAALLAAPSQAQTFSKKKMEALVQDILEQRTGSRGARVECPVATPVGIGNRAVCSATGRDGSRFSVQIIQMDESGGVTYTVTDEAAIEALEPPTREFFELWKANDIEGIYNAGHEKLRKSARLDTFSQLLQCTAADFGGLKSLGETQGAAVHRGDGSGQILSLFGFDAGEGEVKINYQLAGDQWKLAGVEMPIYQVDLSSVDTNELGRHAAMLFERVDAGDWPRVYGFLSYELRRDVADNVIREALDDPWGLGPVLRVEMTSYATNANDLPVFFARLVREGGEQRAWMVFRACGDEWRVRTMQLQDPNAELPLVALSGIQPEIVKGLADQGIEASLKCPGTEIALMPSLTYTCQATDKEGLAEPLEITIGPEGEVNWQLLAGSN